MSDEIKKPEEITNVPLPEKELEQVAGGVDPEPFHVVKFVDASSPKLYESGTSGQTTTPPAK
jgi:type VI protein secretion system component Hcp